jgi:hypothetical protein
LIGAPISCAIVLAISPCRAVTASCSREISLPRSSVEVAAQPSCAARAGGDPTDDLLGRRVLDVDRVLAVGGDPGAVDVDGVANDQVSHCAPPGK